MAGAKAQRGTKHDGEHPDARGKRRGRNGSMEKVRVRSQKATLARLFPVGQRLTHSK